jgi:glyoxylase-like metal-dependent hydrolase (beta-lactamase superfamily II)
MKQIPLDPAARADTNSSHDEAAIEILPDLAYQRLGIVNVVYFGSARTDAWVLIDAGIPGTAGRIRKAVAERFGKDSRPQCIVMTHAHFDHVGALESLAEEWQVPVYAHPLEHPFLDCGASYPPPDPTVGGGMMAAMAKLYPRGPVNVGKFLRPLQENLAVPGMPGWVCLHTPGHTPGHISLWREADRTLVVGDAFITTRQESAYAVLTQKPEMHGPPMYYTQDWEAAERSLVKLTALRPNLVVTGHGRPMHGELMLEALEILARDFRDIAVPAHGRYVESPARGDKAYCDPKSR